MAVSGGFWRVVFGGDAAFRLNVALLAFDANKIYGVDADGGVYYGNYQIDGTGGVAFQATYRTTDPSLAQLAAIPFTIAGMLPLNTNGQTPIVIPTPFGEMTATLERIDAFRS